MAKTKLLPSTYKAFGGSAVSGNKKTPTIMQQAAAGHPNWFPQPQRNASGVGSAGSALLGAGGPAPTQAAQPPAAAPAPAPPISPFATEAQQLAWDQYVQKYNTSVGNLNQRLTDAIFNTNTQLQTAQRTHDTGYDMTNQSLAARGLFQSSIRDGELNDLDTALTMRQNTLNSALNSMRLQIGGQISDLGADYNTQAYNFYQEEVANASAISPNVSSGAPPTAPAPAPAPAQSHAQPSVGQAGSALLSGASALTGGTAPRQPGGLAAGLSHIGGALGQAKPPAKAKVPGVASAGSGLMAAHPNNFPSAMHIGAPS